MHSANYYDTLIEVAEDCRASDGEVPPLRGEKKTIANLEYEFVADSPYTYTSDEVIFGVHAIRNNIPRSEMTAERERFFSKGRPCFRASPLPKTYGWGVHSDKEGRIALVAVGTKRYDSLCNDKDVVKKKAMRSKKA